MSSFGKTYIPNTKKQEEEYFRKAIEESLASNISNIIKLSAEEELAKDFRRRNPDYDRQLDSLERSNQ